MYSEDVCVLTETDDIIRRWVDKAAQDDLIQRRKSLRYPFFRAAFITQEDQQMQAWCRDISPRGIGLLHTEPLQHGVTTVSVCMQNKPVEAVVDLVWNERSEGDWWLSGGRFRTSSADYASLFLSTVSDEIDRRRHQRYPFFRPLILSKGVGGNGPIWEHQTFTLDISSSGLSLLADQPFEPGEYRLCTTGHDGKHKIRVQVIASRKLLNGSYRIAVVFKRLEITSLHMDG